MPFCLNETDSLDTLILQGPFMQQSLNHEPKALHPIFHALEASIWVGGLIRLMV